jgi:sugar lactone lactonase YvrE
MAFQYKVGTFQRPAAGTTDTVVSGLGFTPTVVLFLGSDVVTANTWRSALQTVVGFATRPSGQGTGIISRSATQASDNGDATPTGAVRLFGSLTQADETGTVQAQAPAGSVTFGSGSFTINWLDSPYDTEQSQYGYLAMGGDARAAITEHLVPSVSLGEIPADLSGLGESPRITLAGVDLDFDPVATILLAEGSSNLRNQSIGAWAGGGEQWALALTDEDAANPTNVKRALYDDRAVSILSAKDGTPHYAASIVGVSRHGTTLETLANRPTNGGVWTEEREVNGVGSGLTKLPMNGPNYLAMAPDGTLFVMDSLNLRVLKLDADGNTLAQLSLAGVLAVGGIYADATRLFVAYTYYNSGFGYNRVNIYNHNFGLVAVGAQTTGTTRPLFITASASYVYEAMAINNGSQATHITTQVLPALTGQFTFLNNPGSGAGQTNGINGICLVGGELYVVDIGNNRVNVYNATTAGFIRSWSIGGLTGAQGIEPDSDGNLWIAEPGAFRLRKFSPTGTLLNTLAVLDMGQSFDVQPTPDGALWVSLLGTDVIQRWDEYPPDLKVYSLYLGGMVANCGVDAKPTSAAPAAQVINTGMKAKAALLASHQDTVLNDDLDHLRFSFGVTDGTNHATIAGQVQDAVSTSNADQHFANNQALLKANNTVPTTEASATAAFSGSNMNLTWNPNDAVASQVAWLAFGDASFIGAFFQAHSIFEATKIGDPVNLSAQIEMAAALAYAVFGTTGDIGATTFASSSEFESDGFGFTHLLSTLIELRLNPLVEGLTLDRPLAMSIAMVLSCLPERVGNDAHIATLIEMLSNVSITGLRLNRPLATRINMALAQFARFQIELPPIRPATPYEIPGTHNWHINPSAERELSGWLSENGGVLARTTAKAWDGAWSVKVDTSAASAGRGVIARGIAGLELTGLNLDGDMRRVVGQIRLMTDTPGNATNIWLRAVYTDLSTLVGEKAEVELTDEFDVYYPPEITLDPLKKLDYVELVTATPVAVVNTFYADGVQLEEDRGSGPTPWTVGSYGRETGYWLGAPHLSISAREPLPLTIKGTGNPAAGFGHVELEARMFRATWDNQWVEDISDAVISATVQMDTDREVTWTLDATLTWEGWKRLRPNFDWVAPVLTVRYPDGTVKSGQLGLYFVVPSESVRGEFQRTVKLSAFDPLWLLSKQAFSDVLMVKKNTNRIAAVNAVIDGGVLTGGEDVGGLGYKPRRWSIPQSPLAFKGDREWARDSNRVKTANEILESAGFWPLWTSNHGVIQSRPMWPGRMAQRTPVRVWSAYMPANMQISPWIPRIATMSSEVVGAVKTKPAALEMYDEILVVNDDPSTSRVKVRGRIISPKRAKEIAQRERQKERREDRREKEKEREKDKQRNRRNQDREAQREKERDRNQRERQKERKQRERDRERKRADLRGSDDLLLLVDNGRRRVKRLWRPLLDDEATAQQVALVLSDILASYTKTVELSVLPDPSVPYQRETVLLAIWDSYHEPVAVGQFAVRRVTWKFSPKDGNGLQTMVLDYIEPISASEMQLA